MELVGARLGNDVHLPPDHTAILRRQDAANNLHFLHGVDAHDVIAGNRDESRVRSRSESSIGILGRRTNDRDIVFMEHPPLLERRRLRTR